MKPLLLIVFLSFVTFLFAQVKVKGYYRSNGTYVEPHVRSSPNSTKTDNYSYPSNTVPAPSVAPAKSGNYIAPSNTDVWVNGYYRNDGTYVKGYWRSAPNGDATDNFSYPGNTNPYTGKIAPGVKAYVTATKLNVRSGSSTDFPSIGTLDQGAEIHVIDLPKNNWAKIEYTYYDSNWNRVIKTGYVSSDYLNTEIPTKNIIQNDIPIPEVPVLSISSQMFVKATELNVRSGPSSDDEILIVITKGEMVTIIEVVNSTWVKVSINYYNSTLKKFEIIIGYVSANYLSSKVPE